LGLYGLRRCGELAIVEGTMNVKGYVNILWGNLNKIVHKLGIQDFYLFQQDNDPKHTENGFYIMLVVYWKRLHNLQILIR
jgi:hypothetical protein